MIFGKGGTVDPGPRSCCGLWQLNTYSQSIASSSIKYAFKALDIGDWRIGDADGAHFSIAHAGGSTAMVYRSDGTVHGGPQLNWRFNCFEGRPVLGGTLPSGRLLTGECEVGEWLHGMMITLTSVCISMCC